MTIRDIFKRNQFIRGVYFRVIFCINFITSLFSRIYIAIAHPRERALLKEMRTKVRSLFSCDLNLTNPTRYHIGKNVLGYPTMGFLLKDGKPVGWETSRIVRGKSELVLMQLSVDREVNFPKFFDTYKPHIVIDFGTASGGTAVFFHDLMSAYTNPKILSIDISNNDYMASSDFHIQNETDQKVRFVFGKSTLACFDEVKDFLNQRGPNERVLFSFDDDHTYEHTYKELELFSKLLRSGDVILMQDTWNQDLFGHEVSPMLAVHRFLKENPSFRLETDFNRNLILPCNFIYGVLTKK